MSLYIIFVTTCRIFLVRGDQLQYVYYVTAPEFRSLSCKLQLAFFIARLLDSMRRVLYTTVASHAKKKAYA